MQSRRRRPGVTAAPVALGVSLSKHFIEGEKVREERLA